MITAELRGKLGNMMFEIAAIESMGEKSGILTAYPNVDKNVDDLAKPQACSSEPNGRTYFTLFKNFDWHKNLSWDTFIRDKVYVPFEFVPIIPRDHTCYIGYFQSELYFPNREFVLNLFRPADFITEQLEKYKDIIGVNKASIHVRRGDYIRLNNIYNVLDMNYYNTAMQILKFKKVTEYLIFSNDVDWCKNNFRGDQFFFINDNSFVELYLMSKCAHNIIANSAFSWWGAYLNENIDKAVIAPNKWFASTAKVSDKDIIPNSWIKI